MYLWNDFLMILLVNVQFYKSAPKQVVKLEEDKKRKPIVVLSALHVDARNKSYS